mmetsp:Transcript_3629/g.10517  ORF Transcript_3629/g.10517 Transcript_3629/m.10517 type:complete len:213 (+) Transcript_3629:307-945(+)
MVDIATITVWAGGYLSIVFLSVCLATGLYYLAELLEENTQLAKQVIAYISEATLVLHAVLLLWDRMPLLPITASAAAHVAYLQLLKTYPFFQLVSWETGASITGVIAANVAWGRHFWNSWHTLEYICGFLLMTSWLTPMLLVLSLAANENALPGGGTGMPAATGRSGQPKKRGNRSLLLTTLSFLKAKGGEVLPGASDAGLTRRASLKPHTV